MMTRRQATLALGATLTSFAAEQDTKGRIRFCRVPNGGIQPQVSVDDRGTLHLVYYAGDAHHGDLFYARSQDGGASFSSHLPVNEGGSAIAAGTIRGAQIALGKAGRVHVAWLTDGVDGLLNGKRYLIHDRDPLFTTEFLKTLADAGVASVKLPPRSPNLNAHAERFVRTIKEACLERMILFGEGAVRKATAEFMAHYHGERNHQGLDNALICPDPGHAFAEGKVHRRERLGGLLNYYYRQAA